MLLRCVVVLHWLSLPVGSFAQPPGCCVPATANCIIIDHFSAFEFELVALFLTLPLKNGWQWVKTARNLNLGVSRNRFCDFLADPDSRSFSRFGAIIMQVAVCLSRACLGKSSRPSLLSDNSEHNRGHGFRRGADGADVRA